MANASAKICMYRLTELGDCFLITFKSGSSVSRMLIDCGSFRDFPASKARLNDIVNEIRTELNGKPLDVVVGTHQHNDHVNGFVHCEQAFRTIGIDQVWLSWLDSPQDGKAREIGEDYNNFLHGLAGARDKLQAAFKGKQSARTRGARSLKVLNEILGFYGAHAVGTPPVTPAKGVKILKEIGKNTADYLRPGRTLEMPGLPPGSVRIHVLGPPRKVGVEKKDDPLFRKDPRSGESYDHSLAATTLQAGKFLAAVDNLAGGDSREEQHYPFNANYKRRGTAQASPALRRIKDRYNKRDESWRTIDEDWLQQAETLALWIDGFTNNSSLVLAIEMVQSRKVLLFVADAQTGNWLSWKDIQWETAGVSTDDLLARTVFYKVGHHASHNATLVEAFEKVNHPDLVALIPVHKKDPNIDKPSGWKMPAKNLFKRIVEKTKGRVLQMDGDNPSDCDPTKNPAKAAWNSVGITPRIKPLAIEIDIA